MAKFKKTLTHQLFLFSAITALAFLGFRSTYNEIISYGYASAEMTGIRNLLNVCLGNYSAFVTSAIFALRALAFARFCYALTGV